MEKLRILIADDERPARAFLKGILSSFDNVELIGEAENGTEAIALIKALEPDIALLDLQMPEISGLDVVRSLAKNQTPLIAFVTAFDNFAVQAFELNAIDYLLKPVEKERLRSTLDRAVERLEQSDWRENEDSRLRVAVRTYDELGRFPALERIPVKKRDEIYLVPVDEVASIIADGELLRITTIENQKFEINFRLKDIEPRLDPARFVRLSRGSLVNLDAVSHISPMPGGTYLIALKNGQEVSSSRIQSKILRSKLLRI